MKCPKCGHWSLFDFVTCSKCGYKIIDSPINKNISATAQNLKLATTAFIVFDTSPPLQNAKEIVNDVIKVYKSKYNLSTARIGYACELNLHGMENAISTGNINDDLMLFATATAIRIGMKGALEVTSFMSNGIGGIFLADINKNS